MHLGHKQLHLGPGKMSGSARSFAREGELHAQLHESKNTGEECDSAWLMWEATMLATALDTNRNTNIRR